MEKRLLFPACLSACLPACLQNEAPTIVRGFVFGMLACIINPFFRKHCLRAVQRDDYIDLPRIVFLVFVNTHALTVLVCLFGGGKSFDLMAVEI